MTRAQQRREELVGKYHRNMMITTLGVSLGAAIGLILAIAFLPQVDDLGNDIAYWMLGLPPAVATSVLVFYFVFIIAFACWIQYKRHEH
jgi:ABC-type Fe3+-siderophore transport system permease subunit